MDAILTIVGIIGFTSLMAWFIKVDNTHKANELSLRQEMNFLKEEKLILEEEVKYLKEENARLRNKKPICEK